MMLDLPDPVSPTIKKCLFSASRGMRNGRLESLVVMPIPSPATAFVKPLRTDQKWSLQTASIAQFLGPRDVFRNGDRKQQPEHSKAHPELRHERFVNGFTSIDGAPQPGVQQLIGVPRQGSADEERTNRSLPPGRSTAKAADGRRPGA